MPETKTTKKASKAAKKKAVDTAQKTGGLSMAGKLGRKAKPKAAASKNLGKPEVTVDEKLPGHAAAIDRLAARKTELDRRIGVYEKIAETADFAEEALRLIEDTRDELKQVEAGLCSTGLLSDEYLGALATKKDAEKRMASAFVILDPILEDRRIEMCRAKGEYVSALRVNGHLTYVGTSRVKGLTPEGEDALRAIFGDRYDDFFVTGKKMELNMEALEANAEFGDGLFEAIIGYCQGEDKDPMDFVTETDILSAKEALLRERAMKPGIQELFEKAEDEGLLAPFKATLKE